MSLVSFSASALPREHWPPRPTWRKTMRNPSRAASPACSVSKKQIHLNASSNRNAFQVCQKRRCAAPPPPRLPGTPYPMGLLSWLWRSSGQTTTTPVILGMYVPASPVRHSRKRSNYESHHTLLEQQCAPQFDLPWGERYGGEHASVIRQSCTRVAL
ncbi:hypothetical protein LY78DRAFT_20054 [Colletotrichum sublineola]|nr:hypothetical protein LY78DRAFT_20054 [Colletotrichum sublineola]